MVDFSRNLFCCSPVTAICQDSGQRPTNLLVSWSGQKPGSDLSDSVGVDVLVFSEQWDGHNRNTGC